MNANQTTGNKTFGRVTKVIAFSCAVTAIVLVSIWGSTNKKDYLDQVSWKQNVFAWHPVLMISGFFFSQVMAILSWGWPITDRSKPDILTVPFQKAMHIFWQTAAFTTLIVALYAIFKYKNDHGTSNLSSIHSWIGITAACGSAFNHTLGFIFEALKAGIRACDVTNSRQLVVITTYVRNIHKVIGVFAFGFTTIAIVTGITIFQGHSCVRSVNHVDINPAAHYDQLSSGCKLQNGLVIVVIITAIFVFLTIAAHYEIINAEAADYQQQIPSHDEDYGQAEMTKYQDSEGNILNSGGLQSSRSASRGNKRSKGGKQGSDSGTSSGREYEYYQQRFGATAPVASVEALTKDQTPKH